MDEYGFPCAPTPSQRSRFRVRTFASRSNWSLRFPTLASALAAPPASLRDLALAHGVPSEFRADLWLRAATAAARGAGRSAPVDYATVSAAALAECDAEIARQIELDLPRTFSEQRDFAAALSAREASGAGFDGSRSSAAASAAAASARGGGCGPGGEDDLHDVLRRMVSRRARAREIKRRGGSPRIHLRLGDWQHSHTAPPHSRYVSPTSCACFASAIRPWAICRA